MLTYPIHRCYHREPHWPEAEVLTSFHSPWHAKEPASTEFRALHDTERLHFRFVCEDDDLMLPDGDSVQERVLGSDRVEIFFTPSLELQPYYCLEMSPRGEALVYAARHYRQMDWSWQSSSLKLHAEVQGSRYLVTGSLALDELRALGVLRGAEMHAGLYRADFRHRSDGEVERIWMPWCDPHTEKPDFHVPSSFGLLRLHELA
jgi:hypothetical protein